MATKPSLLPFFKQPAEEFVIAGKFNTVLLTGETIIVGSSSINAVDKDGNAANSILSGKAVDGYYLKTTVKGGLVASSPYKITFVAVTSLGNIWEVDAKLHVVDI
jgi:hypothetical protein